ncbi:MAG: NAD-dependent DNA ligase LigA [Flammeovirgaceae bacterium]
MNTLQPSTEIENLIQKINYYNHRYYIDGVSEISDYEFDKLLERLITLEKQFPQFKKPDSPTQRVGGDITKIFPTVKHQYPMLSLANTYSEEELLDFDERIKKMVGSGFDYVCELKFDGVAISLNYENNLLVAAVTRGDGEQGDDVTQNVKTIKTIPLRIYKDVPKKFTVRGEIFMPKDVFESLNIEIAEDNEKRITEGRKPQNLLANPRNATAGTLKLQDSAQVAKRKLDCYVYNLLLDEMMFDTHAENLMFLKSCGFNVSNTWKKCNNIQDVIKFIHDWENKRHELPLETDGVVVKVNQLKIQEELGFTAKSPRWAVAYKYKAETAKTLLENVSYQVGRTGAVTPVANLKPVKLAGTTVKRASLHNANEIARLDLHLGDMVYVEKSGEIIPKVVGVDLSARQEHLEKIIFPKNCPSCNTPLVRQKDEAIFYCHNSSGCLPQIQGKIEHFVQRKAMNINSVGSETIELLLNHNLIKDIPDLYSLKRQDLINLERFGEKSADNILEGLEKSKNVPFPRVLFALGIRYVGETVAEKLANYFGNIDNIANATVEQLKNVPEIGEKIASSVYDFFKNPENQSLIQRLKSYGLKFETEKETNFPKTNLLEGKSFVISGTFQKHSREDLEQKIKENGGKLLSAVSGKLDYLVAGENMGPSKKEKAEKFGIKIISEEEFLKMLEF